MMTACNERPPEGHPFYGTGVACHLSSDHLTFDEPHSWDIEAAVARGEILMRAVTALRGKFPNRSIERVDSQLPHPIVAYDVDKDGNRASEPYRVWDLPAGPWVCVTFTDGEEFAIWKQTGDVYRLESEPPHAVEEEPIIRGGQSVVREAWERVTRLKNSVGDPGQRPDQRSVGETYDEGEAWVRAVLGKAGLDSESNIDEIATIVNENARATLHNVLSMDRRRLREAAIIAGIAKPTDPPRAVEQIMTARLMHSAGFANGLALGLLIRGSS